MRFEADKSEDIEYAIYTYDLPARAGGRSRWQRRDTRTDLADAMAIAESIFRTGKYGKVEIKQKFFDSRKNRNMDVTLKVYEENSRKAINLPAMFMFAMICAATAYAITLLLKIGY